MCVVSFTVYIIRSLSVFVKAFCKIYMLIEHLFCACAAPLPDIAAQVHYCRQSVSARLDGIAKVFE